MGTTSVQENTCVAGMVNIQLRKFDEDLRG